MITAQVTQGTEEWQQARTGIPTSSNFDKIITVDGKPSKQRQKYLYQLAAERLTGIKEDPYQNDAMLQGVEREAQARNMYEFITGNKVEEVGLCYHDEKKLYASSPDGLVGEDGLVEIKCPLAHTQIGYLLDNAFPKTYFQQVQGQLFVTGRKWCDFFSFYPGLRPILIRVKPDKAFQKALNIEIEKFCKKLEEVVNKIQKG